MTTIKWRMGVHASIEAAAAYAELPDQENTTPEEVVRIARDPLSAWHNAFEWDDTRAAQAYRLSQARTLIRGFVIVREQRQEPLFVHVSTGDGPRYVNPHVLIQQQDGFELLFAESRRDLVGAQRKLAELEVLAAETRRPERPRVRRAARAVDRAVAQLSA